MAHKYKAAIIGCGNIGCFLDVYGVGYPLTHLACYLYSPSVTITAVSDLDLARAQKAASGRKIRAYSDTKELLSAEKPDIVSICTPDADHFDTFKQVASFPSVKGIWCEKPIAINVAQGEEMVQLAKDNGIALVVNYIRRYQSFYQSIKKEMNTLLGEIRRITCYYSGGITTNGSHLIDLLHYFFCRCGSGSARKEKLDYIAKLSFGSFDAEFFPI